MITTAQIKQIESLLYGKEPAAIQNLLNEWKDELYLKELGKSGKIEVNIKNYKKDAVEKVIATPILDSVFAFHKSGFNSKGMTITHVLSGEALCRGNTKDIKAAVKYLAEHAVSFAEKLRTLGETGLRILPPDEMEILRNAHHIANGNYNCITK